MAMYGITDAFSGLFATFGTPGAGFNFMVHNMCRLPGSDGTFMIVQGKIYNFIERWNGSYYLGIIKSLLRKRRGYQNKR